MATQGTFDRKSITMSGTRNMDGNVDTIQITIVHDLSIGPQSNFQCSSETEIMGTKNGMTYIRASTESFTARQTIGSCSVRITRLDVANMGRIEGEFTGRLVAPGTTTTAELASGTFSMNGYFY